MKDLIKKLLLGERIELSRNDGIELPKEEEKLLDIIEAEVLQGEVTPVIAIYLAKEVENENGGERYEEEEIYRLPFIEDYKLLKPLLKKVVEQSHSYFMNRI